MPLQQQIHAFAQAIHRVALQRLTDKPALSVRAVQTLARWQTQRGPSACDPCLYEWQDLLNGDLRVLKTRVCADGDHAAPLRSASPLGFVLSPAERHALRIQSMGQAA